MIRRIPADLLGVLVITLGTVVVITVPVLAETPIRTVLGAIFVVFVPGYATVSALFPQANERVAGGGLEKIDAPAGALEWNVDELERILFSVGLSTVLAGGIGFGLHLSARALRPSTALAPLVAATVLSTFVAIRRRQQVPPDRRYGFRNRGLSTIVARQLGGRSAEVVVNGLLVLSIVLACSTLAFALLFPQDGEQFTEFYLLTENENDGFEAAGYPSEFEVNETQTVFVAVDNHEQRPMNYTLVVELHRTERDGDSVTVVAAERLARSGMWLQQGETTVEAISLSPKTIGSRLRLTFLLYTSDQPSNPRPENAYRETHLWVNVSERSD